MADSRCWYSTLVPLNGNTYRLAQHRNSHFDGSDRLICFDFTSERFGPVLPLPFPFEENRGVEEVLSSLKGEKLSLLLQFQRPSELEVWVTDPYNMSWTNFFKVDRGPEIYFSDAGFFIDEEKKVVVVFDKGNDASHTVNIIGEAGFFRQVDVVDDLLIEPVRSLSDGHEHAHVCSYVPSLVQVKIKKRVFKRKQPSKLDKEANMI